MARKRRVLRGERYVCDNATVYTSVSPSDLQLSIQQPSQREQHSLSGIDLFDPTKVLASGATIPRMMSGLCLFLVTIGQLEDFYTSMPVMDCPHVRVKYLNS